MTNRGRRKTESMIETHPHHTLRPWRTTSARAAPPSKVPTATRTKLATTRTTKRLPRPPARGKEVVVVRLPRHAWRTPAKPTPRGRLLTWKHRRKASVATSGVAARLPTTIAVRSVEVISALPSHSWSREVALVHQHPTAALQATTGHQICVTVALSFRAYLHAGEAPRRRWRVRGDTLHTLWLPACVR